MRSDHDLAHKGRARRPVQLHAAPSRAALSRAQICGNRCSASTCNRSYRLPPAASIPTVPGPRFSSSANAMRPDSAVSTGLDEIVVTAQRRSQSLHDIGIAISAYLVGMKHAVNDLAFATQCLARFGPAFRLFVGLEELSFPMLCIGACGLMNAVGNLAPRQVAELYEATARGDFVRARELHRHPSRRLRAIPRDNLLRQIDEGAQ